MPALAYFLTFSTYGTHLPGSAKGSVDARHGHYGSPVLPSNPAGEAWWHEKLNETPWLLDSEVLRGVVLEALSAVCIYRQWIAHALHVRTTHVHAVIAGEAPPERMLSDLKAYATRGLRCGFPKIQRRRYWANHGSTRYLWNEVSLRAATEYVVNGQGEKMAYYFRGRTY